MNNITDKQMEQFIKDISDIKEHLIGYENEFGRKEGFINWTERKIKHLEDDRTALVRKNEIEDLLKIGKFYKSVAFLIGIVVGVGGFIFAVITGAHQLIQMLK